MTGVHVPDGEPAPTSVHWFEDEGGWWVVAAGGRTAYPDRTSAFQAARELARQLLPSELVADVPPGWVHGHVEPAPPLARPVATEPPGSPAPPPSAELRAGPDVLGRSVLVAPGADLPAPWARCDRVEVSADDLGDPTFLSEVRHRLLTRTRTAYVLDADATAPAPAALHEDVWSVPVEFDFVRESIWSALTSNAVDARGTTPSWPWTRRAVELGATPGTTADVRLPDGRDAWCDGGPLELREPGELADAVLVPREAIVIGSLTPLDVQALRVDLAPDQLAAVREPRPRARIIAPAGSGKTRVLTERARHLLRASVPSGALTLVAFNKRAQLEMVERTLDSPGLRVRTLNALALSILNGTDGFASRPARVATIDEVRVRDLLATLVRFPRRANTDPAAPWLEALSRVRLGLRNPRAVEAEFDGDVEGLAEVFPRYRKELASRGAVDFDEQIYLCLEVLLAEPAVRLAAQRRCQLVLVDEFQDLTPAHMLLLRLLSSPGLSIFGVGDDDQTIYGYSGATTRWLVDFDEFVPSPTHHSLEVNYRCPVAVVTAATNLLSRNRHRVRKAIRPGPANETSPASLRTVTSPHPEAATADVVRSLLAGGARPDEVAVLTRVNSVLVPVQAALVEAGVPVQVRDGGGFLHRAGVAAALAWLRLATAPDAFAHGDVVLAARRPSRGISPKVLEWVGEQSSVSALERLAARVSDARTSDKVRSLATDLRRIADRARTAPTDAILEVVRTETGLERAVESLDEAHIGRNRQAHSDDLRALIALGRLHPDPRTFTAWLTHVLATPDVPAGVTLATVHRVKGLEWPHVVVHDATSGLFPHRLSTDVEEERRVFHVAITRARSTLHLVADEASPSIFVSELDAPGEPEPARAQVAEPPGTPSSGGPPRVAAAVGLRVRWGGYECTIASVDAHHAEVSVGSARLQVPYGSEVLVEGRPRRLAAPSAPTRPRDRPAAGAEHPAAFEALKAWRLERSRRDAVPAFVVASDKTLESIAAAMPRDEASLLSVHGIGATKVELYGDEILAVVDALRPGE